MISGVFMTAYSESLLQKVVQIARDAGEVILRHYHADLEIELKSDESPVTIADQEANALIVHALTQLTPEIPVIAEESVRGDEDLRDIPEFWLVDPLDGTKEFIDKNGDFTVNIALIREGEPVLGVVHPPAHGTLYAAVDGVAWFEDEEGRRGTLRAREVDSQCPTVVVSRSHRSPETDEFLARFPSFTEIPKGSSLKLCAIAAAEADIYPRLGRTMEWDIAAGHAVLVAAGGRVETLDGSALRYGKLGLDNPHFIAWGREDG